MIEYLLQRKVELEIARLTEERTKIAVELCYYAGHQAVAPMGTIINAKITALNWVLEEMKKNYD